VEKRCTAGQATADNIIRRIRFVCWITKATDAHLEYVILIAFPRQQCLRERASVLRYTCIACVVSRSRQLLDSALNDVTIACLQILNLQFVFILSFVRHSVTTVSGAALYK
jgi:hypothetical protein